MDQPRLSLCLIVRDEEAMLPDFLASVAGLWDELIAVDTGSVDRTVDLLNQAGAKVSHFDWVDDFAAARNASLEAATGQWILFLDADERVSPELKNSIAELLDDPEAGAATLVMRNEMPGGHTRESRLLRLFRNSSQIRFQYRIHEDVSASVHDYLKREKLQMRHLAEVVNHLGYVREVAASRDKKDRDLNLLNLSLEQDPDDFYCRYKILEIARFWDDIPLWQQQAKACASMLERLRGKETIDLKARPWSGELAAMTAQGLDLAAADEMDWLKSTNHWATRSAAWLLRMAFLQEQCGLLEVAAQTYQECLAIEDEAASQLTGVRPLLGLCRIALVQKKDEQALGLALKASSKAPSDPEALMALATFAAQPARVDQVLAHLKSHPEGIVPLGKKLMELGRVHACHATLAMASEGHAEAAIGLLVSGLVIGKNFDREIAASQEDADSFLREWVGLLWQGRHTEAMAAFADNCTTILGVFPWLGDFLTQETQKLKANQPKT